MIEPLRLTFAVDCPPERTFTLWTERISTWWPADHTAGGDAGSTVVLEPGLGGGCSSARLRARRWRARNERGWSTLIPHYEEVARA
jgi:hypothetical protein